MFSRPQRDELNDLSSRLFGGSANRWQKMIKNKSYWVPTGETEKVSKKNYFFKTQKTGGKTMMSIEKAKAKGLLDDSHEDFFEQERQIMRKPHFEELKTTLEYMLDSKLISALMKRGSPEDVRFLYAYRFVKETLRYSFGLRKSVTLPKEKMNNTKEATEAVLEVQEDYEKDFQDILASVGDEKLVERINDAVVDSETFAKIGGFEAVDFVSDVVFCQKNPTLAEDQIAQILEEGEVLLGSY